MERAPLPTTDDVVGLIDTVVVSKHSIVLIMENERRLLIEGNVVFIDGDDEPVPLMNVVGRLPCMEIIKATITDDGGIFIELPGPCSIVVGMEYLDQGVIEPFTVF